MKSPTKREWAITLAESDQHVFPLVPNGKEPALRGDWKELASNDPGKVAARWTRRTTNDDLNYNIGIRTGLPLRGGFLVVIDVDVRDGKPGRQALADLEARLGALPPTFKVRTASGGEHWYFLSPYPLSNSQSKIGPCLDVKGQDGYVVGPGSTINGEEYTLLDVREIAALRAPYVELCGRPRKRTQLDRAISLVELDQETHISQAVVYLSAGAPLHGTYRVACRVRGYGVSRDICLDLMMEHWPPAEAKGEAHVAFRVDNAYQYAQDPLGIDCAEVEFEPVKIADRRADTTAPLPGAWQQPADLWEQDKAPDNIPDGIVPHYVERFSRDRARRLGVDDGAMTAATITSMSALVPAGNNLHLRQHSDSWSVKSVIWTAIIGDPGTAKSPAVNAAMAFPKAVEKLWREEFAKEKERFGHSQPADNGGRRKRNAKNPGASPALAPGQEELAPSAEPFSDDDLMRSLPTEPRLRRKVVNDATTEALGGVLANCPDAAPILLHSDELAGIIGGMDAYRSRGSKDRPFFLSAKEGASFAIDRKSSGTTLVPALAIGILGTIQDDKLSKIAPTLTDDGFLQRFAPVMIRKTGRGEDIPDNRDLDSSVPRVALALVELETTDYRLAPDAAAELDAIEDFKASEYDRFDLSPALKTWLSKTPNEFGRYCLAFHLIEWATGIDPALGVSPEPLVPRNTAVRARRYVQEFLYAHAKYVYGTVMTKAQDDDDVRWVAGYILTRELATITAREIGRAYRSLRGSDKRAKLKAVMSTLAMQDWVKLTNETRGEWKVNPAVHDGRFRTIKESEARRRAAVKAEIAATVETIRSARGNE
ncbi:hypothetical protein GGQ85_001684 [Nitrobacter vulgaris]|uniref:DUF3987 domain-containing protein n=1 Tax=Nitrobacter vulgaris TaxID=29421 RepID=UPI00286461F5|nr:DUF3987 domain-containing protein [Nitrobacter vulgaris]MDR6303985.1 hypothetical protein [Nitrobacter vulgaris]